MTEDETKEELAKSVGEMRETVQEKLERMEAEGVTCIPIADVRFMLTEHYNFMGSSPDRVGNFHLTTASG